MEYKLEDYYDVKRIVESTKYWFIRTEGGSLYNEYRFNEYISLGWNYITKKKLMELDRNEHQIRKILTDEYDEKQPTRIINQCKSFVFEMKENDYVIFPDEASNNYTIAKLIGYYEEEVGLSIEEEKEWMENGSKTKSDNILPSPYQKRWKIEVLNTVASTSVNPQLYIALRSPGSLMNIDKHYEYLLSLIYPVYQIGNTTNITFDVNKTEGISARELNDFTSSLIGIFDYFNESEEVNITQKTSLNSPGSIMLKIEDLDFSSMADFTGMAVASSVLGVPTSMLAVGIAIVAITGGEAFGLKLPGIINVIQEARMKNRMIDRVDIENEHLKQTYKKQDNNLEEQIEGAIDLLIRNGYVVEKKSLESLVQNLGNSAQKLNIETEELSKVVRVDFNKGSNKE